MMQVPQSQWKPYLGLLSAQEEDITHDPRGELIKYFKGGFARGPCGSIMRGRDAFKIPGSINRKERSKGGNGIVVVHTLDALTRGFFGGKEANSAFKKYALQILSIKDMSAEFNLSTLEAPKAEITFFGERCYKHSPI